MINLPARRAFAIAVSCAFLLAGCARETSEAPKEERAREIAALDARLDRIQDANDIKRLQRAYGFYFDKAEWDQIADLFAADATLEFGHDGVYVGQARIREYLQKRLGNGRIGLSEGEMNNHMLLQPVVHVAADGRTAKARWRALIMQGRYKQSATWGEGTYENEYVKDGGVWKISKLHFFPSFYAPYESGWAKLKPVDAYVSSGAKELPPDRPSTLSYKPYPAAFVPPYHFGGSEATQAARSPEVLDPSLAPWALEVSRLEAHSAVENLQAMYGYYFDKNQWDAVADLFADDATYEIGQRGVYKGKKRIREALNLIGPAGAQPGLLNNELQLQPVIHVSRDGKTAKARWRTTEIKGEHGKSAVWGSGIYENEYALVDGEWKISKLHYYLTFRANYEGGWSKSPLPIEGPSETLPADAPPTEVYGSLPEVYLPPFHYANPGSRLEPRPDPGTPPKDLAALAKRISLLNDEIEVQNVQRAYGYYVDRNLWDEVSELFAENGSVEIGGRGVFVGKKRVNQYMHFLGKQGPQHGWLFDHSQWQPVTHVSEDGKTAKQRLRAFVMGGTQGTGEAVPAFAVWGECTYENEYVKENGVWKIAKLYGFFNMYTPYSDGWGKTAMPITKVEKNLPPDLPPTRLYEMYPTVTKLDYHYKNPVTGK